MFLSGGIPIFTPENAKINKYRLMRKLALIAFLLPFTLFSCAGNGANSLSQLKLGAKKKELIKFLSETDKSVKLEDHKIKLDDIKKSDNLVLIDKNITAYLIDGDQFVFDGDRLAQIGLVSAEYEVDSIRFIALDELKSSVTKQMGEPINMTGNTVTWLNDSELYAISTRNKRIYTTIVKSEWVSEQDKSDIQSFKFKYYDSSKFDLTLQDISGFRNKMSESEFASVFKKKLKNPDSFNLQDYVDPDNQYASRGYVKYDVEGTKAMFINDVLLIVSGSAYPSLTEAEKEELVNAIVSVQGPPRQISNRYTWRNKQEGLDLIFDNDVNSRYNLIFIIGLERFFRD